MKKWLCFLLAALFLVLCVGCGDAEKTDTPTKMALTKDDAIAAAEAYWNVKSGDRDPETDALISVVITAFPSEDNPYYRAVLRHMSAEGTDGPLDPEPGDKDSSAQTATIVAEVLVHQVTGDVAVVNEK